MHHITFQQALVQDRQTELRKAAARQRDRRGIRHR